jgi:hypothetical protein
MLTGVAGAGKTTLLKPLVAAWRADARFSEHGREVLGAAAMASRHTNALQDAGICRTYALARRRIHPPCLGERAALTLVYAALILRRRPLARSGSRRSSSGN